MATVDLDRRPHFSFGDHIRFITDYLPKDAHNLMVDEEAARIVADNLAEHIRGIAAFCGSPENAAKLFLDLTADIEEQRSEDGKGDHYHRPLYEMGPKRMGALVAISRIPAHSNQNPEQHEHPTDCIEFVVPITSGMFSLTIVNGEKIHQPIPPLTVFQVERGALHSDYNDGDSELVYVIFRAKLM